jgi:hypothetical protein
MGGFVLEQDHNDTDTKVLQRISPRELWRLLQTGALPWSDIKIDDQDIDDHIKADWITKLLALAQILRFSAQIIGRAVRGLSVTTLELFTLGIVYCAIITYLAQWEKPFDIHVPTTIRTSDEDLDVPTTIRTTDEDLERASCFERAKLMRGGTVVSPTSGAWWWSVLLFLFLSFGSIHIAAWTFHFPTATGRLLWRISSVGGVAIPMFFLPATISPFLMGILAVFYIPCRLYMFVGIFTSLRDVPASVYQTPQWSQYFPSFG